jgi:VWFA-related protein
MAGVSWLLAALLLLDQAATAQEKPPQEPARIEARVELVNLAVTVTDARGHALPNLKRQNFRVLDEGVEQSITQFVSVEEPALVFVLLEASPAVYLIQQQHLVSAHMLLQSLGADDWVGLATYADAPKLVRGFTRNKAELLQAMRTLRYNAGMGQLNLFDSLATVLDWLAAAPGKKSLVLLSTGLDTSPPGQWDALVDKLRRSDVAIYSVALGGKLRDPPKKGEKLSEAGTLAAESFARATQALNSLAQISGGVAFAFRDAQELEAAYRRIATFARHQYYLGFAPAARDGRFHRIEVQIVEAAPEPRDPASAARKESRPKVSRKDKYRVFARQGYVAPQ